MALSKGFIKAFSMGATDFHFLNLTLKEKLYSAWSNQFGKIILTASQFACHLALDETPDFHIWELSLSMQFQYILALFLHNEL